MGETAIEAVLAELQPIAGPGPSGSRPGGGGGGRGGDISRDGDRLVTDGRDNWLSTIAFHAVHDEEFLKLRAGPGLGYKTILGLPDGTLLNRQNCVTKVGQLWCKVSLVTAPGITGYVSADYLSSH